ncbi:unnamed protein product [Didymodactylos carnosus]|uniref:Uncharacterized protein n=1 Tax=Didymodactylos carnosus TaxID=1234261 RepID=A0A8S2FPZ4_9BILA|nr:unnamed protein product [Didymodactylos carnosus]CAF4320559.1 unnamed protein product [Didymodactylos carnosus]
MLLSCCTKFLTLKMIKNMASIPSAVLHASFTKKENKMFQVNTFGLFCLLVIFSIACCDTNSIQIVNSGSTNTAGYNINIERNGQTKYSVFRRFPIGGNPQEKTTQLEQNLRENLFANIEMVMPLSQYPVKHCMKSASFGYSLRVTYNEQTSPDLACPLSEEKLVNVNKFVRDIVAYLNIKTIGN